jgi:hypothetical protein
MLAPTRVYTNIPALARSMPHLGLGTPPRLFCTPMTSTHLVSSEAAATNRQLRLCHWSGMLEATPPYRTVFLQGPTAAGYFEHILGLPHKDPADFLGGCAVDVFAINQRTRMTSYHGRSTSPIRLSGHASGQLAPKARLRWLLHFILSGTTSQRPYPTILNVTFYPPNIFITATVGLSRSLFGHTRFLFLWGFFFFFFFS